MTRTKPIWKGKSRWAMIMFMLLALILPSVSAVSDATTGTAILYVGVIVVLLVFLVGCFFTFVFFDNLLARVISFGVGYLLVIALSFIVWQMGIDFLTSPFLIEMFRIIFLVFMIGAFPVLIGAFAWYLFMIFKIKEIQQLMDKGMDQDEAQRRVKRK